MREACHSTCLRIRAQMPIEHAPMKMGEWGRKQLLIDLTVSKKRGTALGRGQREDGQLSAELTEIPISFSLNLNLLLLVFYSKLINVSLLFSWTLERFAFSNFISIFLFLGNSTGKNTYRLIFKFQEITVLPNCIIYFLIKMYKSCHLLRCIRLE